MLLGAGLGARLKPFTDLLPKPLIPVFGTPCIQYSFLLLKKHQVSDVVVNVHAHSEKMNQFLDTLKSQFHITVSDESKELLGSAGGFRKALPHFNGESFFGLNADVITNVNLQALASRHMELRKKHGVVMTLALLKGKSLQNQDEQYREINMNQDSGLIVGFGEKKRFVPFYSGVGVFEAAAFEHLKTGIAAEFVPEVLEPWIKKNKVGFFEYDDLWVDIGSPQLWWQAHQVLEGHYASKGEFQEPWKGWIKYGKDATPQNFLGKKGIQLDNLCYECKV